ncbi:hypothetical protein [Acerihabitans sp.]
MLSFCSAGEKRARAWVDFSGDFGHEIGLLEISVNSDGKIARVDASLE